MTLLFYNAPTVEEGTTFNSGLFDKASPPDRVVVEKAGNLDAPLSRDYVEEDVSTNDTALFDNNNNISPGRTCPFQN